MKNFYQATLVDKLDREKYPAIILSSEQNYILLKNNFSVYINEKEQDYDLFGLVISYLAGSKLMTKLPEEDERKLYVYYVADGENYTGKFIGSHKKYSELPENPLLVYYNDRLNIKLKIKLKKENLISIDGSNFHKAVQVTYNKCYVLSCYKTFILCEHRNVRRVMDCDVLITYLENRLGLNDWLFDFRPLIDRSRINVLMNISYETIFNATQCEKLSKSVSSFYNRFLTHIEIPKEYINFISNNKCDGFAEWKYTYFT